MIHEKSCGALVVRRGKDGKRYILMIRQRRGGMPVLFLIAA